MEVCNLNNKDDKKPGLANDAASNGLDPALNKLGAPSKFAPLDPVPGNLPPYPMQPGFSPNYPPGQPPYPGQPNHPGYQDQPNTPNYPGYPDQPGFIAPCPGMELARAYICIQRWGQINSPARALETGTLFPELFRPYPH